MRLIFRLFETLSHAFVAFRRRIAESSVRAYLMQALRREEDAQAAFNAFLRAYDTRDGTRHAMHGVININDADALLRRMILTIDPNSIFPISQIVRVNGRARTVAAGVPEQAGRVGQDLRALRAQRRHHLLLDQPDEEIHGNS